MDDPVGEAYWQWHVHWRRDDPILHIRAQRRWHDNAYLIGSRQGLLRLRQAIDQALAEGVGFALVTTADDEGYVVSVFHNDAPPFTLIDGIWQLSPKWHVPLTYTDPDGEEEAEGQRKEPPPPWGLLSAEDYAARREEAISRQTTLLAAPAVYMVCSIDQETYQVDVETLVRELRACWPEAEVVVHTDPDETVLCHWSLTRGEARFTCWFPRSRHALWIENGSADQYAAVALWFRRLVPPAHRLSLFCAQEYPRQIELQPDTTVQEVADFVMNGPYWPASPKDQPGH